MDHINLDLVIEIIGWISTCLFISSFLVRKRSLLHSLGFAACIFKMIYSYHYHVWPLFVNWVLLFFIELYQWRSYKSEEQASIDEKIELQQ